MQVELELATERRMHEIIVQTRGDRRRPDQGRCCVLKREAIAGDPTKGGVACWAGGEAGTRRQGPSRRPRSRRQKGELRQLTLTRAHKPYTPRIRGVRLFLSFALRFTTQICVRNVMAQCTGSGCTV